MSERPSLRRVLLLAIGGVALGAVVLTALLTFGLTRLTANRRAFAELTRQAEVLAQAAAELPCRDPRGALRRLGPGARFVPDGAPRGPLAALEPGQGRIDDAGRDFLYVARETSLCGHPGLLVTFRPAADAPALPEGMGTRLLLAAAIGVAVAAGVAYVLARRLSTPLAALTSSVRHLGRGEDVTVTPSAGDPDEVAELKGAVAHMAAGLREAREREQAFLLSVTHELKTPLTAIRGWGEALADGTARGGAEAGRIVVQESARLDRLVQDLLDLARISAGEFSVELEDVDLGPLVRTTVEALRPVARDADVHLDATVTEDAAVRTDPDRVRQMLSNLLENALRVTPAGGTVSVEVGGPAVTITDSGPGLTPTDVEHAFDRFYLWRRYRGERPVGTGLGLAITGELAALLDVGISIDAPHGGGTRFRLRFDG